MSDSLQLEKYFRSPHEVAIFARKYWDLVYKRTCCCEPGSGFREEISLTSPSGMKLECSCSRPIVRIDDGSVAT